MIHQKILVIFYSTCSLRDHVANVRRSKKFQFIFYWQNTDIPWSTHCWKVSECHLTSRLDYCNSLLFGIPKELITQLQMRQNHTARVITQWRKYDHITPVLVDLHWLPVKQRIDFMMLLLYLIGPEWTRTCIPTGDPLHSRAACTQPCNVNTHSRAHCSPGARLCEQWWHGCVNNGARLCASARLCRGSPVIPTRTSRSVRTPQRALCDPRKTINWHLCDTDWRTLAKGHALQLHQCCGTTYRQTSNDPRPWTFLSLVLRLVCSNLHILRVSF